MFTSHSNKILGLTLVTLFTLMACHDKSPTNNKEQDIQASSKPLPSFEGSGSEPFWSMTWNGSILSTEIGIDKTKAEYANLSLRRIEEGWVLTHQKNLKISITHGPCLDLAGHENTYSVEGLIDGQRLVGCANPN